MKADKIIAMDKQNHMALFARHPLVLSHGEGPYVFDVDGGKYLDFLAGIAVNIVGHAHPKLTAAIADQAARIIHCSNLYYTAPQAGLAEKLTGLSGLDKAFFCNSGAEANEGAIKLARKYGKTLCADRVEIISAQNSFHGRTMATLAATAQPKYQKGYEPLPQGFDYVPFNDVAAMEKAVSAKTCAVLLEPIQGEGGVNVPDPGYLAAVKEICAKHGALLIFDEIQTGMGRSGKLFAWQHYGVKPDIMTLAKGLAGGVPIGALLANAKVATAFAPGDHGSTFGGNPLACAAAGAVLDIVAEEGLLANAAAMGAYLSAALAGLRQKYPALITEVRGLGLIAGIRLSKPGQQIVSACMGKGLLINCTAGDVLRFVPPLNINKGHIDEMIGVLDEVFANDSK